MQYEKVILEMLSRIQVLEEQVKKLQEQRPVEHIVTERLIPPTPKRNNMKVTEEMLEACYKAGKKAQNDESLEVGILADQISLETGMNRNNAMMTIYAVLAMLKGELYKRGISGKATKLYFDRILKDYGKGSLQKAIAAMRLHIDYRRSLHHNVDLLEIICDQYQAKI